MMDDIEPTRRTETSSGPTDGCGSEAEFTALGDVHQATSVVHGGVSPKPERRRACRPWLQQSRAPSRDKLLERQFLGVLSHELRNSLAAISNATGVLRSEATSAAAMRARVLIERQVRQMSRVIEDLLDVSRINRGQLLLSRERADLCAIAAQAAQTVECAMREHDHRMTLSLPDTPIWMQLDPCRIEQVIVNLLVNAAKYTDNGGDIRVSVTDAHGEAIVRIRDTGIGIAPEVLPRVFDLFVQVDPSSERTHAGLGIGLALVRSLVESHGGCVTAASGGLCQGSEFTVRLPHRAALPSTVDRAPR